MTSASSMLRMRTHTQVCAHMFSNMRTPPEPKFGQNFLFHLINHFSHAL